MRGAGAECATGHRVGAGYAAGLTGGEVVACLAFGAKRRGGTGDAVRHWSRAGKTSGSADIVTRCADRAECSSAGETIGRTSHALLPRSIVIISRNAVGASSGGAAIGAVANTLRAPHHPIHEIANSATRAGGGSGAVEAIGELACILAVVDHHVVGLIEILTL